MNPLRIVVPLVVVLVGLAVLLVALEVAQSLRAAGVAQASAWRLLGQLWPSALAVGAVLVALLTWLAGRWMTAAAARLDGARDALLTDSDEARARSPLAVTRLVDRAGPPGRRRRHELWLGLLVFAVAAALLAALAWRAQEVARPWLGDRLPAAVEPGAALPSGEAAPHGLLADLLIALAVSVVLVREAFGAWWERSPLKPLLAFETHWADWRAAGRRLAAEAPVADRVAWLNGARHAVGQWVRELADRQSGAPLAGAGREVVLLRLAVFLTALSDELLRPFFAVFAAERTALPFAASPTLLAALPVTAFMVALALAQPLGPWVARKVDVRRALLGVSLVGALLLAVTPLARDGLALLVLRAGSGAGYGLALILAQAALLRIAAAGRRAQALVEVPAAIVAAGVCGPVLGGLLVERLGPVAGFLAGAACLAAAAAVSALLAPLPATGARLATLGGWRGMAAVMLHRRVAAVTWCAAVPARLAAAALLVVVTPLYLQQAGQDSAVAGRVLLLYFIAFMAAAPLAARWSDRSHRRAPWIVAGCLLSALACGMPALLGGAGGMATGCALLGVGQALLSAPQLALVTEAFDRDPQATQVVGATPEQALAGFRFIERFGSIVAPLAVAAAVGGLGLLGAVAAIGAMLAAGGFALLALLPGEAATEGGRHARA